MSTFIRGHLCFAALAMALAVSGCANKRGGSIPYGVADFAEADPLGPAVLSEDYHLAPGDKLTITVFRVEDLSGEYAVDLAGTIALPLIGTIDVSGMTARELATVLETRLGREYLRDPKVTVGITESTGRLVTVDGSVREPGTYPVTARMTLIDAIAKAKGTDDLSNPRRVAIFRRIDGQRMVAAFDLTDIRQGVAENPSVYPGDIVVVDGSSARRTMRDILAALPVLSLFRPY